MTVIITLLVAPFTILTFFFAVEVLAGLRPLPMRYRPSSANWDAVIVVPAHDEGAVLPVTLQPLVDASEGRARILLVADNCTDATAATARHYGVEVIERRSESSRGKGFALDFAKHHLAFDPPDIVLIVDADCVIDAQSLTALIEACGTTTRPCQATNLQRPRPDAPPPVQLSTFAFFIKNVIRQRGLQRLAGRAHLLGTGMALPWQTFVSAALASSNIVEDLKLGQDLSDAGHAPLFVENATVWSNAETERNTLSQRSRWEGGFIRNAIRSGPRLLGKSLVRGDPQGIWAAMNLMLPPVALLITLDVLALCAAALLCLFAGAHPWPIFLLALSLLLASVALGLAWRVGGRRFATLGGLARIPIYIFWKLPMYLAFLRRGAPKEWQRTDRT